LYYRTFYVGIRVLIFIIQLLQAECLCFIMLASPVKLRSHCLPAGRKGCINYYMSCLTKWPYKNVYTEL